MLHFKQITINIKIHSIIMYLVKIVIFHEYTLKNVKFYIEYIF